MKRKIDQVSMIPPQKAEPVFVTAEEAAANRSWLFWRTVQVVGGAVAIWFAADLVRIMIQSV